MSHLSILPTLFTDVDCLAATLEAMGLNWRRGGLVAGFGEDHQEVELQILLGDGQPLGWARQQDGSLALVGDLQRISRSTRLQDLLGRVTRSYAARRALQEAAAFTTATIDLRV